MSESKPISKMEQTLELLKQLELPLDQFSTRVVKEELNGVIHAQGAISRVCKHAVRAAYEPFLLPLDKLQESAEVGKVCLFCSARHSLLNSTFSVNKTFYEVFDLLEGSLALLEIENFKNFDAFENMEAVRSFKRELRLKRVSLESLQLEDSSWGRIGEVLSKIDELAECCARADSSDPRFKDWLLAEIGDNIPYLKDTEHYNLLIKDEALLEEYAALEAAAANFHKRRFIIRPHHQQNFLHATALAQEVVACWGKYKNVIALPLAVDRVYRTWGLIYSNEARDTIILDYEPLERDIEALDVLYDPGAYSTLSLPEAYEVAKLL